MTTTKWAVTGALALGFLLFMIAAGGLVLVLSIAALAVTLVTLPMLWFTGRRRRAGQLLTAWGIYLAIYVAVSTGITLAGHEPSLSIGQEICADSGCFAVDKVDIAAAAPETSYMVYWHLSSNDKQLEKHFPGKGLELYLFDERGRKFALPDDADQNPLDVTLPAGETVRRSMTFHVPADSRELYLTAKYRPLTFQSMLPGELSLIPHRPGKMIRIQ